MRKEKAHSIQNCLLYVLAKLQGLETNRTRATSNFLRPLKTKNSFCEIAVCEVTMRLRCFANAYFHVKNANIQDYVLAQNIFTMFF